MAVQIASALGGSWVNEGVEDSVFLTLQYPDNVLVHIEASWMNPSKRRMISVVGSEQMLMAFGSAGTMSAGLWEFLRDAATLCGAENLFLNRMSRN